MNYLQALFDGTLRSHSFSDSSTPDNSSVQTYEKPTNTLLVFGAPNTGKTRFAIKAALAGMSYYKDFSQNRAYGPVTVVVQNRNSAARYSNEIINKLGASLQSRPVGTLSALAFRILSALSNLKHTQKPRLLNGAEQDSLLRSVIHTHMLEVVRGDNGSCETCKLFTRYFNNYQWNCVVVNSDSLSKDEDSRDAKDLSKNFNKDSNNASDARLDNENNQDQSLISSAFVHELRDMLARLDELSIVSSGDESRVLEDLTKDYASLYSADYIERLRTQWSLAFRLRKEYRDRLRKDYNNSARYDSSGLMIAASKAVKELADLQDGLAHIPVMLVVDDFQDVTLGGLDFLNSLSEAGVRIVLTANPDESVQSFRGAYPDYVIEAARHGFMRAAAVSIEDVCDCDSSSGDCDSSNACDSSDLDSSDLDNSDLDNSTFVSNQIRNNPISLKELSRNIDNSIASLISTDMPLSKRLWKYTSHECYAHESYAHETEGAAYAYGAVYRSAREELDTIIWQIKRAHLDSNCKWSDIAIIAHDNATVRAFGEKLSRDGVPVRYSSVKKTLRDEPFVQGLFAMIELAQLSLRGLDDISHDISVGTLTMREVASYVRSRFVYIMNSPLVQSDNRDLYSNSGSLGSSNSSGSSNSKYSNTDSDSVEISESNYIRETPMNINSVEILMRSISSLQAVVNVNHGDNSEYDSSPLRVIVDQWQKLCDKMHSFAKTQEKSDINTSNFENYTIDNSLIEENPIGNNLKDESKYSNCNLDACYWLLLCELCESLNTSKNKNVKLEENDETKLEANDNANSAANDAANNEYCINKRAYREITSLSLLSLLHDMCPSSKNVIALIRACRMINKLAESIKNNSEMSEPKYVLGEAWNICNVAEKWQIMSLHHNDSGRIANERLDIAMRLFAYVKTFNMSEQKRSSAVSYRPMTGDFTGAINLFIEQVLGMEIEADSLARVAPLPDAVTLATPAGAAGNRWPLVWIPAVQQRIWPNVDLRNTMFGSESLVDMTLNKRIVGMLNQPLAMKNSLGMSVNDKMAVYTNEQRSFFVACTRAIKQLYISAVRSDDLVPSDFLFRYMPAQFLREEDGSAIYTPIDHELAAIDTDARALVCFARAKLMNAIKNNDKRKIADAVCALKLLSEHDIHAADFETWDFVDKSKELDKSADSEGSKDSSDKDSAESKSSNIIRLSPSKIDALWNCPVCALLENEFSGPQKSNTSTNFGTLIHNTACWACKDKSLDTSYLEENYPQIIARNGEISEEDYLKAVKHIADSMREHYIELASTYSADENVRNRYMSLVNQRKVDSAIYDIANYFVESAKGAYSSRNILKDELGRVIGYDNSKDAYKSKSHSDSPYFGVLKRSYSECQLRATFGFEDIARIYYKTLGVDFNPKKKIDSDGKSFSYVAPEESKKIANLRSIMGYLVGGWPIENNENMLICISGRMDRMEVRSDADNLANASDSGIANDSELANSKKHTSFEDIKSQISRETIRLIDYKTGIAPSEKEVFSDLQLVCYQLALRFFSRNCEFARAVLQEYFDENDVQKFLCLNNYPSDVEKNSVYSNDSNDSYDSSNSNNSDVEGIDKSLESNMLDVLRLAHNRRISGSMLFHVVNKNYPAESRNMAENMSQPALFMGDKLNTEEINKRTGFSDVNRLYGLPVLDENSRPSDVDESYWSDFINLPPQAQWSLMMISRVFFAASAMLAEKFEHEPTNEHVLRCRCGTTCPACAGKSDAVYEIRTAAKEAQKLNIVRNSSNSDIK